MSAPGKVLVVEDEAVLQDVYKLILSSGGYDVHTASDGVDGLKKIKTVKPDVVLLDIFMPRMDGKDLLRNIDLSDYPHMRVIMYSNLSDKATESEVRSLGAHDFILKSSMTPNDLLELVKSHL
jgi:DNA-binding response OmpR family regulator